LKKFDDVLDDFGVWAAWEDADLGRDWIALLWEHVARPSVVSSQGKKNVAPLWAAFFKIEAAIRP
jgi:hypothetical protein